MLVRHPHPPPHPESILPLLWPYAGREVELDNYTLAYDDLYPCMDLGNLCSLKVNLDQAAGLTDDDLVELVSASPHLEDLLPPRTRTTPPEMPRITSKGGPLSIGEWSFKCIIMLRGRGINMCRNGCEQNQVFLHIVSLSECHWNTPC